MFIVGLTGGIGSGKTTVSDQFKSLGIEIIDTDFIARQIVEPGTPSLSAIAEHFGAQILTQDGRLNRSLLRSIVFSQSDQKRWLEDLMHPLIRQETRSALLSARSPYAILSSPLLLESDDKNLVNRILVVDLDEAQQVLRSSLRDSTHPSQIVKIIAAQMPRQQKLAMADDIIDNSGSLAATRAQVARLHEQYLRLSQATDI